MIEDGTLRVALSALFAGTAVWFVGHGARRGSWADRVCDGWHALMSLAMVAMAWPWGMGRLVLPQLVVFGLATVWFVLMAVLPSGRPTRHRAHTDRGRWLHWLHVVMMLAMVWMLAAMPQLHGRGTGTAPAGWVLSGLGLLALLLAGTALSITAALPLPARGTRAPLGSHAAHVAMGAGMAAMVTPMLT